MTKYRMVYDCGSKLLKCAIADDMGNIINLQSIKPEVIRSKDGFQREWNYRNYWENLIELTKNTIINAKINSQDIEYITASSIRPSCVFADEDNKAVYIGASFELRGIDYAEEIEDEFFKRSGKTLYKSTGHFPSLLFIPARYKFFQEEDSENSRINKITQYLPLESWILIKFGGEIHTNYLSAGESGFFDIEKKIWHPAWNDIFDLPDYFFPWPVFPGEVIGLVDEKWKSKLNLSSKTKLVAGCPDTQAALLGCQAIFPSSVAAVLGTTTPVQAINEELIIPKEEISWSGLMMVKNICDHYYLETNTGMTGQILKWIGNLFYSDEDISIKRKFNKLDKAYIEYDHFEQTNSQSKIEEVRVQSLLGPAPLSNTQMGMAPGIFTFQSPGGVEEINLSKRDFVAAAFNNILFAITKNIKNAIDIANIKDPSISIMGGISRNPILLQRFSDLLNSRIITPASYETTIQGMLVLCDIAAGNINKKEDLNLRNQKLNLLKEIHPRKDMIQKLRNSYQSWLNLFNTYYK